MSKNKGPKSLAQELTDLPAALDTAQTPQNGESVILARMVSGLTCAGWKEVCQTGPFTQWFALPVAVAQDAPEDVEMLQANSAQLLPVSPFREVRGALTKSMFISLLKRELLRIARNNGSLSLVAATLANRREITAALGETAVQKLDSLLGTTLLDHMEACDALGLSRKGVFICSLPGVGQLAARHFAESSQEAFNEVARPLCPDSINGAAGCSCAIGIVNIMQGESCAANDLMRRARIALEAALLKPGANIHQEAPLAPFEGTTLVHSSEKRFLFFGGDPE